MVEMVNNNSYTPHFQQQSFSQSMSYGSGNNSDHESHFGTHQSTTADQWNENENVDEDEDDDEDEDEDNIKFNRNVRRERKKRLRSNGAMKSMTSDNNSFYEQENGAYNSSPMNANVGMNMGVNLNIPTQDFIPGDQNDSLSSIFPLSTEVYKNVQHTKQGFKSFPTKKVKKVKKMKKSKRHRKRHVLPGPAGAIQLTSESSLLSKSKSSTSIDTSTNMQKNTSPQLSMTKHHDANPDEMKFTISSSSIPTIIGTIIRIQEHPAWKSMCVALSRYTPHISQYYYNCCAHPFVTSNINNITKKKMSTNKTDNDHGESNTPRLNLTLSKFLRYSIPNHEYATIAEIHQGMYDCFVSKFLVVYISNVYLHSHCDYTCECMDESGMSIDGWINEQFVKERQEEAIKVGAVLLLKRIAITIYQKKDEDEFDDDKECSDFYFNHDKDVINNVDHANKNADQSTTNIQANKVNNIQRMLLIGEETVVCWWKPSDAANVTYNEETHLMKKREEMWKKIARNDNIFLQNQQSETNDFQQKDDVLAADSIAATHSPAKSQAQINHLSHHLPKITKNSIPSPNFTQVSKKPDLHINTEGYQVREDNSPKILHNSSPLVTNKDTNITINPKSFEETQLFEIGDDDSASSPTEIKQHSLLLSQLVIDKPNISQQNEGDDLTPHNSLVKDNMKSSRNDSSQKRKLQLSSGAKDLSNKPPKTGKNGKPQQVYLSQNATECNDIYADLSNKNVIDENILSFKSTTIPTVNNLTQDSQIQHKVVQNPYRKSKSKSFLNMVSTEKKPSQHCVDPNRPFPRSENGNKKSLNPSRSQSPNNDSQFHLEKEQINHNPNFEVKNKSPSDCNQDDNDNLGGFRQSLWIHFEDEIDTGLNEESEKKDIEEFGHPLKKNTSLEKIHERREKNLLYTNRENVVETDKELGLSPNPQQTNAVSLFENANMFHDIDLGNDDLSEDD